MSKTKTRKVILIAAILLTLTGVISYFYINHNESRLSNASPNPSASVEPKPSNSPVAPNSSESSDLISSKITFKIPELGISILLPESLSDLTYTFTSSNHPIRTDRANIITGTASFSTRSLTAKYPECSSSKANPLGSATKITGVYSDDLRGPTSSSGTMVKQLKESFLTFTGPQWACYFNVIGNDATLGAEITSKTNALSDALKNAQEL